MTKILYATKDNAEGQLAAGITAVSTSIILGSGEGAEFPQPYTGTTSSAGDANTLNDTGALGDLTVGDFIRNVTDGSWAFVKTLTSADTIETTPLRGGSDNTWDNGDEWQVNEFIVTIEVRDVDGDVTAREKVLIKDRSTDTLTARTRGYDGSEAQSFDADDYVNLHVTSNIIEHMIDCFYDAMMEIETNETAIATTTSDLASVANGKGASLIGIEDSGNIITATTVEGALAEIQNDLDTLETITSAGIYGNGSDGALNVTSGTTTLDFDNKSILIKQYTSINISVGATLDFSNVPAAGGLLILLSNGNVTIAGTIDMDGDGSDGGGAVTINVTSSIASEQAGNDGTAPYNNIGGVREGGNGNGDTSIGGDVHSCASGGGGGGNAFANGTAATTASATNCSAGGGSAGLLASLAEVAKALNSMGIVLSPGGGGGSGGVGIAVGTYSSGTFTATSGAGGAGGGSLFIGAGGDVSFTGTITLDGVNGSGGSTAAGSSTKHSRSAGGGGGGSAGTAVIVHQGELTDSGTKSVTGGSAGGKSNASGGGSSTSDATAGGAGATGSVTFIQGI